MKTLIFYGDGQMDLNAANGDFQQLELDLHLASSAKILCFQTHRDNIGSPDDEVSRRLLDFAATLPDW